jgi:hypothetical protein
MKDKQVVKVYEGRVYRVYFEQKIGSEVPKVGRVLVVAEDLEQAVGKVKGIHPEQTIMSMYAEETFGEQREVKRERILV